jgi:hypothetical protein
MALLAGRLKPSSMLRGILVILGLLLAGLVGGSLFLATDVTRSSGDATRDRTYSVAAFTPPPVSAGAGGDNDDGAENDAVEKKVLMSASTASAVAAGSGMTWSAFQVTRKEKRANAPEIDPILENNPRARLPVGAIAHLAYPPIPVAALPLFNVTLLFRTALIREKPRNCFLLQLSSDDKHKQQETLNASSLISQLQLVSTLTPERIPIIPLCHDDLLATLGDAVPASGQHATYEVGFVFDGERCSTNMWHGLLEVVVPLFAAKTTVALRDLGLDVERLVSNEGVSYRQGLLTSDLAQRVVDRMLSDQRASRHVLFMKAPRKNIWGVHNLGCPILNHYPYGWSTSSVSGWLLYSLFDGVGFGVDGWPKPLLSPGAPAQDRIGDPINILFFGETPSTNRKYEMRLFGASRTVLVKNGLYYGPSALCRWSKAFDMPPKPSPPYYLYGDPLCPFVYDVTKKYALAIANITEAFVTKASLSCPRVGIVIRRTLHNGRGMRNFDEVVAAIEAYVANGGPSLDDTQRMFLPKCGSVRVINLEGDVPFGRQIELVHSLDVVMGARGMGLTNSIFMKKHAGLLVWSGREIMGSLNVANDNYPWNPLHALRQENPAVLSSCPVVFPTPESIKRVIAEAHHYPNRTSAQETATYAKRCVTRSVNFCDMRCDVAKTIKDFDRLLFMMKASLEDSASGVNADLQDVLHISDRW